MAAIDLLVYHDFTDTTSDTPPPIGTHAGDWLGTAYEGLYVVAVAPPVHGGRAATVVLAHSARPMPDMQARLEE